MQLKQSFELAFPRAAVWSAFRDIPMLVSCLPGASLTSAPDATPLAFAFTVKLGPISANFAGQGSVTYADDFTGGVSGGGTDRGTNSRVRGDAKFSLHEIARGTRVEIVVDYALTGMLAQVGRAGIVKDIAAKITQQFAANLQARLESRAEGVTDAAPAAPLDGGRVLWSVLRERIKSTFRSAPVIASGLDALCAVRPFWTGLARADAVVSCEGRWLLHAGPPYADARALPAPVLSSAVLACLYEGWADSEAEAERMIASGDVRLEPAQSQRCVTPLAALVSPSTTLLVVEDASGIAKPAYAPLGTTGGADLRFGTRDRAILARLAARDGEQREALAPALRDPIDLLTIAVDAVKGGDDLHNRTTAATARLVEMLEGRLRTALPLTLTLSPHGGERETSTDKPNGRAHRLIETIRATPLYFLTVWMAAAKLMLSAAEGLAPATLITRMAGNGHEFGVSVAGRPDEWICVGANAPRGGYLPNAPADAEVLGAIGDSAVIDALGFGGQALRFAPEPLEALRAYIGADAVSAELAAQPHPAFSALGLRVGIDAAEIVKRGEPPIVTLAMVERAGTRGLLGRGVYRPPVGLFERACLNT